MAGDDFMEIQVQNQKLFDGTNFPSVLSPTPSIPSTLPSFIQAIKTKRSFIDSLLHKSGALLFRGFPVNTASDFNNVVEAFGFDERDYVGGAGSRTRVIGRVLTSNESPPDQKIPFHHEMSHVPDFPSKLFFFCEVEPGSEGETPLVLSHRVHDRMKDKFPDFVKRLEEHGLIYTRVLGEVYDTSSPIGASWKSAFSTEDKTVAEQRANRLGMKLEWLDEGVKTTIGPIPGIKYDKTRERNVWFNNMVAVYTAWEDDNNDPVKAVTFGDGEPLPGDIIYDCLKIHEEESVAIPWQKGDVLLVDNWAVLHGRKLFRPPRRILVSLCK